MPAHAPLPREFLEKVAHRFRLLGEPSRLEILQALMSGPKSVGQVVEATGMGQANVSKHLAALAAGGVVRRTPRGTQAIFEVSDPLVFKLCDLVCGSIRTRIRRDIRAHERMS